MDRPRLTTKQAEAVRDRIRPMVYFLYRCRRRLDVRGFDKKGAIYQVIDNAYCAMHDLHMKLHYESCGPVVGRAPEEQPEVRNPTDQAQSPPNHSGA